jgi:DNA-directed RNA polymerase subunit RPC12/RpoP
MTTMQIVLAVVAVLVVGGVGYLFVRRRGPEEPSVFYYTCKTCKRKFSYKKPQMGHQGMCPRCKERFIFPVVRTG